MDKENVVRDLLAQMRSTLANEQRLPQAYVDSCVINLSSALAVQVGAQSEPFDWATFSDVRRMASY